MRPTLAVLILTALATQAAAQWQLQQSNSTADLRGIHALGSGVAWASGSHGTVLRTTDQGQSWQSCAIPPGAEALDFRGIQAFDAETAIVMSSGKGDLSRLYKTTDACKTWKLVFTNPDKEGFWDALKMSAASGLFSGALVGDPVDGKFPIWWIVPEYERPANFKQSMKAHQGESAFAASNTAIFVYSENFWLGTGGPGGAHVLRNVMHGGDGIGWVSYKSSEIPVGQNTDSSGVFSLAFDVSSNPRISQVENGVAVGGDYLKADDASHTAAFSNNGGKTWRTATTPPHGYRSAVAYFPAAKSWITVGPNGTDLSTDDGRNWRALHPTSTGTSDEDKTWNALSLPFVVGPKGRIGLLRPEALKEPNRPGAPT